MRAVNKAEKEAWGYTDGPNWLPIVIGAGVAVVVAGGVVWFLLHRKKKKAMTNAIVFLLLCSMLIFVPSCSDKYEYVETKENCYLNGLQLYEIKELYDAAGQGEQSFDEKIVELKVKSVCTRDEFLTAYNHFKDQVIVVPNSDRFEQSEFVFEYTGTSVYFMDAETKTTSVDMVCQTLRRSKNPSAYECSFYGAASMDPIYGKTYQEHIQAGNLVDARPMTPENLIQYIDKEGFRIEAYVEPYEMLYGEYIDYSSLIYYLFLYRGDTYVGHFQIFGYPDRSPRFYWPDFEHLDLMTLEEAIQSAQPPASEK